LTLLLDRRNDAAHPTGTGSNVEASRAAAGARHVRAGTREHPRIMPDRDHTPQIAGVVDRNIVAILSRRADDERRKSTQDRVADRVTRFTGSMLFVYLHLAMFGAWIVINAGWTPIPAWDESFVVLAMIASVEAIFLSTFVLISQNRMQALADKRADLDLQVSLLSEHEITHLITLVSEIAKRMGIDAAHSPEIRELAQDVAPEKVLDHMEEHERRMSSAERAV
jgi:uncharacterized membrane protein